LRTIALNFRDGRSFAISSSAWIRGTPALSRVPSWKKKSTSSRRDTFSFPVASTTTLPVAAPLSSFTSTNSSRSRASSWSRASTERTSTLARNNFPSWRMAV